MLVITALRSTCTTLLGATNNPVLGVSPARKGFIRFRRNKFLNCGDECCDQEPKSFSSVAVDASSACSRAVSPVVQTQPATWLSLQPEEEAGLQAAAPFARAQPTALRIAFATGLRPSPQ